MKISWTVKDSDAKILKEFLKKKDISKNLLTKIKFEDGELLVNHAPVRVNEHLNNQDLVTVVLPQEEGNPYLAASNVEINVLYEDMHYLIINKPAGVYSVPSLSNRSDTMANRVKGYIQRQHYPHQKIHVATRLDQDTTGVMIFPKHAYAHSLMDKLSRKQLLNKYYIALVAGQITVDHSIIKKPIARAEDSIIERVVSKDGKEAITEFWVQERFENMTKLKIQLHTGRTHQIRVHFSYKNYPLVGDDFYGGSRKYLNRHALHCEEYNFIHPITNEFVQVKAPIPVDLSQLIKKMRSEKIGKKKTN